MEAAIDRIMMTYDLLVNRSAAASAGRKSPTSGATDAASRCGASAGASTAAKNSRYPVVGGFAALRTIAAADGRASGRRDVSSPAAP